MQLMRFVLKMGDSLKKFNMKFVVVCLMALVACAILIVIVAIQSRMEIRFSPKKKFVVSKTMRQCKPLRQVESVNWNYFYYYEDPKTKKSLVWCKVPKAGSTSLTKLFLRLAGAKNLQNNTRIHKMLRDFYPRLSPPLMKQKLHISKSFMVVRDPFERILSAYRDKLENYQRDLKFRDGYYYEHYGKYMVPTTTNSNTQKIFPNSTEAPNIREPSFKEFVSYLIKTSVSRFDEHWMPITRLCSPCNVHYDNVIKMEKLQEEMQTLLKHVGVPFGNLGVTHKTGTANKRIITNYFKNLTLKEVKKLYTKYKRDFQIFGYTPFKYFHMASKI